MPCVLLLSQTIRRDEVHLYSLILPRCVDGCQIVILQRFQQELRLAARAGASPAPTIYGFAFPGIRMCYGDSSRRLLGEPLAEKLAIGAGIMAHPPFVFMPAKWFLVFSAYDILRLT